MRGGTSLAKASPAGWVEFRTNTKRFVRVYMQHRADGLHIFPSDDMTGRERKTIPYAHTAFSKVLTTTDKIPEERLKYAFQITELYKQTQSQFLFATVEDYLPWINCVPLHCKFADGLFGFPLALTTRKDKSGWRFPLPLYRCIDFLQRTRASETVGIFRISGNHTSVSRIKSVFDSGADVRDADFGEEPSAVASSVVKLFLRELTDGIIPASAYPDFVAAAVIPPSSNRVPTLRRLVGALPEANRQSLWYLISYLVTVAANAQKNQMTPSNLAVCFAPSVFAPVGLDPAVQMANTNQTQTIFESFITSYQAIFADEIAANERLGMSCPQYPAVVPPSVDEIIRRSQVPDGEEQVRSPKPSAAGGGAPDRVAALEAEVTTLRRELAAQTALLEMLVQRIDAIEFKVSDQKLKNFLNLRRTSSPKDDAGHLPEHPADAPLSRASDIFSPDQLLGIKTLKPFATVPAPAETRAGPEARQGEEDKTATPRVTRHEPSTSGERPKVQIGTRPTKREEAPV